MTSPQQINRMTELEFLRRRVDVLDNALCDLTYLLGAALPSLRHAICLLRERTSADYLRLEQETEETPNDL